MGFAPTDLAGMLDRLTDGIAVLDEAWRFEYANRRDDIERLRERLLG